MLDRNTKIQIVGGTGAMGKWLTKFLESLDFQVSSSDEKIKPVDLEIADIVFVSVPIHIASKVIFKTAKKISKDCLIIDLSSIKSETRKALLGCDRPAMSMHFLFGSTVSSIQNQKITVEVIRENKRVREILELFKKSGGQIIEMNSESHDFAMAHIQALTHFINLSLAQILIKNKIGIKTQVSTPVFLSQVSSTLRVLSQNPKLLSEIQVLNPKFLDVARDFIEIQEELVSKIKAKKIDDIEKQYETLRENLESVSGKSEKSVIIKTEKTKKDNLKIGFLGPMGTFSNQAVLSFFNENKNSFIPIKNIYDLFESLNKNEVDLIVAPAENTIEGTIRETLDLLFDYDLKVIGKIDLEVSQNLLSKEENIQDIKKVISHPQAINQSRVFLEENLPQVILESGSSTIASVKELDNPGVAIIGSLLAAKIYKLNILEKNIQNFKENVTRFYIVAKKDILNFEKRTKTILFLSVFNRVGILRDILGIFADLSINLNKIESRPSKEKHWDYYFYIEIELTDEDPKFIQVLNILKQYCPKIVVLGKL